MSDRPRGNASGSEAVSDVVGSLLLVGLTVGMTVVLASLLFLYDGPEPAPRARLGIAVLPGDGGWDTGDEQVVVRHLGGHALDDRTHLVVAIGAASSDLTGPALGGAFADGRLSVGEAWTRAATIRATDLVRVDVVGHAGGATALLASASLVPGGAP